MTAEELAECWVPVPMRWRNIAAGDVIQGRDGRLLAVESTGGRGGQMAAHLYGWDKPFLVDPDEVATVLLPAGLRDAMELTRDELGAQLLERRGAA